MKINEVRDEQWAVYIRREDGTIELIKSFGSIEPGFAREAAYSCLMHLTKTVLRRYPDADVRRYFIGPDPLVVTKRGSPPEPRMLICKGCGDPVDTSKHFAVDDGENPMHIECYEELLKQRSYCLPCGGSGTNKGRICTHCGGTGEA